MLKEVNFVKEDTDVFGKDDLPDLFASTANETSYTITSSEDGP